MLLKIKGLNQIIRNKLLLIEADLNAVSLTRDEFDQAFRKIESGYKEDSFWEYLKVRNISSSLWKQRLKNNLLINKFIDTKFKIKNSADEKDAEKYYEAHKEQFKKSRMLHAVHIMVSTEDEAKIVFKAIKLKKKTFLQLARMYSSASEASEGDNIGFFEVDQMPEEFASIAKLKKNQISEVIKTPYGYHIFKIVDIKAPKQLSYIESRDSIFDLFSRDEQSSDFERWLIELKNNSNIKINENVLSKIRL
jgi:parvulin-like peptidyl-prolyl isomerase